MVWRWVKGDATGRVEFGIPQDEDDYVLCLYDESDAGSALVYQAVAPAGEVCDGGPCWSTTARGLVYDDPDQTPDGIRAIDLEAGAAGDAKAIVLANGTRLALPVLPLPLPLRAQLQAHQGGCWQALFSQATRNDGTRFEATAD